MQSPCIWEFEEEIGLSRSHCPHPPTPPTEGACVPDPSAPGWQGSGLEVGPKPEKRGLEEVTECPTGSRTRGTIRSCSHLASASSQTQVFWLLNRRWRCCPRQRQTGRGSPHWLLLQGWAPRSASASSICLPLAHKFPFLHPPFVLVLPWLPWNFSPYFIFPTPLFL